MKHIPVLLHESIKFLNIKKNGIYIDATIGCGGHAKKICNFLNKKGIFIGIDKDYKSIILSKKKLKKNKNKIFIFNDNYINIPKILFNLNIKKIDGILFDLGMSSYQLDDKTRGFSYRFNSKLDMRFNKKQLLTAKKILNLYDKKKIMKIFEKYGEIKNSNNIVKNIIKNRPFKTTFDLLKSIKNYKFFFNNKKKKIIRKIFQALRIEVNNELIDLKNILLKIPSFIKLGGRIVVISFHSLEDSIVKKIFNSLTKKKKVIPNIPHILDDNKIKKFKFISKTKPSINEIVKNNRSRSAIMRVIERVKS